MNEALAQELMVFKLSFVLLLFLIFCAGLIKQFGTNIGWPYLRGGCITDVTVKRGALYINDYHCQ